MWHNKHDILQSIGAHASHRNCDNEHLVHSASHQRHHSNREDAAACRPRSGDPLTWLIAAAEFADAAPASDGVPRRDEWFVGAIYSDAGCLRIDAVHIISKQSKSRALQRGSYKLQGDWERPPPESARATPMLSRCAELGSSRRGRWAGVKERWQRRR